LISAVEMKQPILWIAFALAVAMMIMPYKCLAASYTVGDTTGWTTRQNYTAWTSGKTFRVGDTLVFKYTVGEHDTESVTKANHDSCTVANPLFTNSTGNDIITLNTTGAHYFICGIPGHCGEGMKLAVTVVAASTPTPSGSPSPPPPSEASPPPPSSTGSNESTAAPSYHMDGVVLAGASLVLAMVSLY